VAGCFDLLVAGLGANFEWDLRKIISLSNLRQLSLIIVSVGLSGLNFPLLKHALCEALLFIYILMALPVR
jgi:NADH-ubiquinone oxidoreductase chain 5